LALLLATSVSFRQLQAGQHLSFWVYIEPALLLLPSLRFLGPFEASVILELCLRSLLGFLCSLTFPANQLAPSFIHTLFQQCVLRLPAWASALPWRLWVLLPQRRRILPATALSILLCTSERSARITAVVLLKLETTAVMLLRTALAALPADGAVVLKVR